MVVFVVALDGHHSAATAARVYLFQPAFRWSAVLADPAASPCAPGDRSELPQDGARTDQGGKTAAE
eukprot:scaffold26997_cov67-Phaeocystis_antarctica.AAC.4